MKNYIFIIFIVFSFVACQKEASLELGNGGPTGPDTLVASNVLTRAVSKVGNDSIARLFNYDARRKLTSFKAITAINTFYQRVEHNVARNGNGIIENLTVVSNNGSATENTNYIIKYNPTMGRYTSKEGLITVSGQTLKDSTVFSYDGSKRLNQLEVFFVDPDNGAYLGVTKILYTYNGNNNISKISTYGYDETSNGYVLYYDQEYEYDGQINPLPLNHEAIIFDEPTLSSLNNVTKQKITSYDDPNDNELITYTYTYNSEKKPLSGIINSQNSGDMPITFYYQ